MFREKIPQLVEVGNFLETDLDVCSSAEVDAVIQSLVHEYGDHTAHEQDCGKDSGIKPFSKKIDDGSFFHQLHSSCQVNLKIWSDADRLEAGAPEVDPVEEKPGDDNRGEHAGQDADGEGHGKSLDRAGAELEQSQCGK